MSSITSPPKLKHRSTWYSTSPIDAPKREFAGLFGAWRMQEISAPGGNFHGGLTAWMKQVPTAPCSSPPARIRPWEYAAGAVARAARRLRAACSDKIPGSDRSVARAETPAAAHSLLLQRSP